MHCSYVKRAYCSIFIGVILAFPSYAETNICHRNGSWFTPENKQFVTSQQLVNTVKDQQVVLLGEQHDIAEHHRWQLQTISEIHALRNDLVLGFEMFPRRVQKALDAWVAGELSEKAFLDQSEWKKVWGYDPELYMPIFHFARINRVPMIALNVDRSVVRTASKKGVNAMSDEERQGISIPAAASTDYLELLANTFGGHSHGQDDSKDDDIKQNPQFLRFVDAQQLWDRAMAEGIAKAAQTESSPLVIGIMGTGHIVERFGVPHQLEDLGIKSAKVLLPGDHDIPCQEITARTADGIFSLPPYEEIAVVEKPKLGVHLMDEDGMVKITKIVDKSIAEISGLQQGDVFISVAGKTVDSVSDIVETVQAMQVGTWLPLEIKRDGKALEIIAKFPQNGNNKVN